MHGVPEANSVKKGAGAPRFGNPESGEPDNIVSGKYAYCSWAKPLPLRARSLSIPLRLRQSLILST
jgi:hypothetical protein